MKSNDELFGEMKALSALTQQCAKELHSRGITAGHVQRLTKIMSQNTLMIETIENQLRKRRVIN